MSVLVSRHNLKIARVLYIHSHTLQCRSGIALSSEQISLEWDHSLWMRDETEEKRKKESRTRWRVTDSSTKLLRKTFPSITHSSYCVKAMLFRNGNFIPVGAISVSPVLHEGMQKTVWHDYVSSKRVTTKWVNKPYSIHADKIRDKSKLHSFIQHPPHFPFLLFFKSVDCQLKGRRWATRFAIVKTLET